MRNTPPTELMILEMAQGFQSLIKNPDLSKIIEDTYGLMDSQREKVREAEDIIRRADEFIADLNKKAEAYADIKQKISAAEKIESDNEETLKLISRRQRELDDQQERNKLDGEANKAEEKRLSVLKDALEEDRKQIDEEARVNASVKANLKKKADALKAQTADL